MDERILSELTTRRSEARAMGGPERLEKLRAGGKLNARERLGLLLDPGSFTEIGVLARSQHPDLRDRTPADGLVAGYGTIDGRTVYVTSEDASVLAGTRGRVAEAKTVRIRELAFQHNKPFIALMEAGAGRFQENNGAIAAGIGNRFREHFRLSGRVPQVAAVMGACFGGPAFTAAQSDCTVLVKGTGFIGMSGPPVVKVGIGQDVTNDELGGADVSGRLTGQADHVAEDDADCLRFIREFLSFFPSSCFEAPPRAEPVPAALDTPEGQRHIRQIVSENHRRAYDMREVIALLVDGGHSFPYRPLYGPNLITAWARMDGQPVGIIASNPMQMAGVICEKAAQKVRKFVDICDAFHIPLVFLTDCPGFLVGPDMERHRMVSLASRLLNSVIAASVPKVTVILRKAIGLAYLALGGKTMSPDAIVAWPTARFDVMGPAAGVELVYGREIAASPDPKARRAELLREADEAASAYLAAEMALIDDVIDPAETRAVILGALARCRDRSPPGFKHRIDP